MLVRKAFYYLIGLTLLCGTLVGFLAYYSAFKPNIKKQAGGFILYVYPQDSGDLVLQKIDTMLEDPCTFYRLSQVLGTDRWKPGKYVLRAGMDNFTLFKKLRNGMQDPVNLTFNNVRDIYELSGVLGQQLMLDSAEIVHYFTDSTLMEETTLSGEKILCRFIPNTYQVYWNISAANLFKRMEEEHEKFWSNNDRRTKAARKNLKPDEVYILASIVEKETNVEDEKGLIAGVYLNRLQSGMKLQADPTVVYATGRNDVYRVLHEHLKLDSPFNTYLYEGLPPGPIFMPSISSIDSVLESPANNYLFFCAKPGYEGRHVFAETLKGHSLNATAYRRWLDKENIR